LADANAVPRAPAVLLIDEHELFLSALKRLLTSKPLNASVVLSTRSSEAVAIVRSSLIDVVVCDVQAKPVPGTDLSAILSTGPHAVPVILLTEDEDGPLLAAFVLSPAAGLFRKDTPVEEFLEGIAEVLRGGHAVGRTMLQPVLDRLTPPERKVVFLVGRRQSDRAIAASLGLSQESVRDHLAQACRKLGLQSRAEAGRWAVKVGLAQ